MGEKDTFGFNIDNIEVLINVYSTIFSAKGSQYF